MTATPILDLRVVPRSDDGRAGVLRIDGTDYPCALGKGGCRWDKREGDGATPIGAFALKRCAYRPDRMRRPLTALPTRPILPTDGWSDDPTRPETYNRPVRLPYGGSHERLWRDDGLYDLIVVVAHNDAPPVPGIGSAIFLHVARPDFSPTEGCVALARPVLAALLPRLTPATLLTVTDPDRVARPEPESPS